MHATLRPLARTVTLALLALAAAGLNEARAQNCEGGTVLTQAQVTSLLTNRYACGGSGGQTWNEQHSGSSIIDYKKGPTDPVDPSTTVGSFTITGESIGLVTYVYSSGGTYSYQIRSAGAPATTTPGVYSFCGQGGAGNWSIIVSNTGAGCAAP